MTPSRRQLDAVLTDALLDLVEADGDFAGTAGELLDLLNERAVDRGRSNLPPTPAAFVPALRRLRRRLHLARVRLDIDPSTSRRNTPVRLIHV